MIISEVFTEYRSIKHLLYTKLNLRIYLKPELLRLLLSRY
jgi:hypothetical protein